MGDGDKNLLLGCAARRRPWGLHEPGTGAERGSHARGEGALSWRKRCAPGAGGPGQARGREGRPRCTPTDTTVGVGSGERGYSEAPGNTWGWAAGGAGLGLCIAKTIAEAHGGRIDVQSTPDTGSTFVVVLPLAG